MSKETVESSAYEEAMDALSSLITKRTRADKSGDRFDLLFDYIKILELEEPIKKLNVIHVAGTKGKGSTCAFVESILCHYGFRTGLFTSPHLIDVRERFKLDGIDISERKFLRYFRWCYDKLKENATDDVPMPTLFRFLALLAFKIFCAEEVHVAILEVGLGGKFDATNVVKAPVVCGISSLGYDHMEILGNTLSEIAAEKAGIFKEGVPAFTVPQPEEAMHVLEEHASKLNIDLEVVSPLNPSSLRGLPLSLDGEHQFINAGLAVALCTIWLKRTGYLEGYYDLYRNPPEQFIKGLTTASLQGRAQIVSDQYISNEGSRDLVFYFDGAHTPESMEVCASWFSSAIKKDEQLVNSTEHPSTADFGTSHELGLSFLQSTAGKSSTQILLFNCMSVRDPQLLLPRLMRTCASHGVRFEEALFVPNMSVYHKLTTNVTQEDLQVDLSFQLTLQKVWESLIIAEKGGQAKDAEMNSEEAKEESVQSVFRKANSRVFRTLPLAIKWLRENAQQNPSVRFQVLVAGSLHLVGDVMRLIRK